MRRTGGERIEVTGVVQGVGYRPFVHRLATEAGLDGFVGNDPTGVFIEVTGPIARIDEFARRLVAEAPSLAQVESVTRTSCAATGDPGFRIVDSRGAAGARTLISPDSAVCDDCVAEMNDPDDRRYGHAFITCTNCGPRFTIIRDLPYDRPNTTMSTFDMCDACASEYRDPVDRRYHAETIACRDCGPVLRYCTASGDEAATGDGDSLRAAVAVIRSGGTVAVKGLGGYHLACDATDDGAVERVRRRKHRPDKPFAVMVADLDDARRFAEVSDAEAAQLLAPARPIVLVRARADAPVSTLVAAGNPMLGIMLPSTPVHHLLFRHGAPALVMTSGNIAGEPLAYLDDEAATRLADLCDGFLTHDRDIHLPCDDSVVRVADDILLPIRRARGFAPLPVPVGRGRRSVLAVGGEFKNTFCLASTERAFMSQHLGDMENLDALEAFERIVMQFERLHAITPELVAVDAHPRYATSRWAHLHYADRIVEVQHHHAHIAAVMAEHECDPHEPVIGFAFDGTGYGDDGTIWGGEVLLADADGYVRIAHLAPVDLPGGDAAIRNPCRVALAHLRCAGIEWTDDLAPVRAMQDRELDLLDRQLVRRVACVPTTSMGRLFDAVASLLGLRHHISYEAQAAIQLEMAAVGSVDRESYQFALDGPVIDQTPVVRAIVDDLGRNVRVGDIARRFHAAVRDVVVEVAQRTRGPGEAVALSGGVFQNALLVTMCVDALRDAGFRPLTHHLVPPNDGGLALGQAFVAAHRASTHRTGKES